MALEIERRFLVRGEGWRRFILWQAELQQGYLHADARGLTLRVRSCRHLPLAPADATPSCTATEPDPLVRAGRSGKPGGHQPPGEPLAPGEDRGPGVPCSAVDEAWLTLKAPAAQAEPAGADAAAALTRLEFEYPIPLADAQGLLAIAPHRLGKRRYGLSLAGGEWVLDVFSGENAPLVVAEVELESADAVVEPPPWCVLELTGRHELSNAALARTPFRQWPPEQRRPLLEAMDPDGGLREWGLD
ncbi:MAG: CYTH domain-containing protein [Synechococcaceae cyanobacterium]|nr:CYTH domain-containing protein [Synechococcaceae cyanobacterium]